MQFAIYAGSLPYDIGAGHSVPWPYDPPSRERALVVHLPAGEGRASAHWVDLRAGSEALHQSMWARQWRKRRDLLTPYTPGPVDPILAAIARADSETRLNQVWVKHQNAWTEQHTAAAKARKAVLAPSAA